MLTKPESKTCSAVLVLLLATVGAAGAQSTRSTRTTSLDGSGNVGNKIPAPNFKLPKGVTVKKTLTVKKNGDVEQKCKFTNGSGGAVSFLFCNMIALNGSHPEKQQTNNCNIKFDAGSNSWKCTKASATFSMPPSYHFGCTAVSLAAGGSTTTSESGSNGDFAGEPASDFDVSYADIFDMSGGTTFDAASCAGCFGANMGINFGGGGGTGRNSATGFWIMSNVPITDPYVVWQEPSGFLHPYEYYSLDVGLALPSDFPVTGTGLTRAVPGVEPPFQYTQDLNLWDIFTMSAGPEEITPVMIEPFMNEESFGVEVAVDPTFAEIAGESMEMGTVTIQRPFNSTVPEGAVVPVSIAFLDANDPDVELWEQNATMIQDTVPPVVTGHTFSIQNGVLSATITAMDATTEPLISNLWYSLDGGVQWQVLPLEADANAGAVATFSGSVELDATFGDEVQYFYNVQDTVFNHVWFGPLNMTVEMPFPMGTVDPRGRL